MPIYRYHYCLCGKFERRGFVQNTKTKGHMETFGGGRHIYYLDCGECACKHMFQHSNLSTLCTDFCMSKTVFLFLYILEKMLKTETDLKCSTT